MVLTYITDQVAQGIDDVSHAVSGIFSDRVIRLGVTGLSRAGKTVFITSLVANLLERGRMPQLSAAESGAIRAAFLQPQPDDTIPRFDYEHHLATLTGTTPAWPQSTRAISELRLSLKVQPTGMLGTLSGPRTIHLDIVDYPGEWMLDLKLLDLSYAEWSAAALQRAEARPGGANYLKALADLAPGANLDEPTAQALAAQYATHLTAAQAAGFADCTPGRFLLPGELAGSPALTFAPLPADHPTSRGTLAREMERRYEAYKSQIVKPFFRDHFARIDRQVVLVDVLSALRDGPAAIEDLRQTMTSILAAFRTGTNTWLSSILGRRVDRILFAATKADHLHHEQHPRLTALTEALLKDARQRADYAGAETRAMSIAAFRATTEETRNHNGDTLGCVRGLLEDTGAEAALYPGDLPENPSEILTPARDGQTEWLAADYQIMRFLPQPMALKPGDGPPHIRLDRAAEFLIGDRLT